MHIRPIVVAFGVISLLGTGCTSTPPAAPPAPSSGPAVASGSAAGDQTGQTIPANFPHDVIVYPGASVMSAGVDGADATLVQQAAEDAPTVELVLTESYKGNGLPLIHRTQDASGITLSFQKDALSVVVTLATTPNGTRVSSHRHQN